VLLYKQASEKQDTPGGNKWAESYFSTLATIILLIVLLLLVFPAIRHITTVNKEISDARLVKAALEKKVEDLQEARGNLANAKADLPILDLALPIGSDVATYLKGIEGLAGKYNLKITAVQFSNVPLSKPNPKDSLKPKELPYSLTLQGNFLDFQKFLTDLENYIRTSEVSLISIGREQDGTLKETLNITTYYSGVEFLPTKESSETSVPAESETGGSP
jgi:Tfp pilus assembly protein PilO